MALRKRADTYVARNQFKEALPDLQAALKLKPDDPDILQNLQYVQAKAAPPPPPVAAAPVATPPPPPAGMSMPMKIGIGVGALIVIIVIAIVVTRRKVREY